MYSASWGQSRLINPHRFFNFNQVKPLLRPGSTQVIRFKIASITKPMPAGPWADKWSHAQVLSCPNVVQLQRPKATRLGCIFEWCVWKPDMVTGNWEKFWPFWCYHTKISKIIKQSILVWHLNAFFHENLNFCWLLQLICWKYLAMERPSDLASSADR